MLLRRNEASNEYVSIYDLNENKCISIEHNPDHEILKIDLIRTDTWQSEEFRALALVYLENITVDPGCEWLDTDAIVTLGDGFEHIS